MPTPTPHPNLPSLTAIAASNGALGVLALHALSLHDCIAALDARLAAVEARDADAPDAPTFERIAAAYTKQTLDLGAAQDEIAALRAKVAALVPAHDKAMADLAVLTAEHERLKAAHETHTEWPVVRAAIDALAQSTNARERTDRICDLRVKIEAYATTRHAAETAATIAAGEEIDALRAKLADETQRRVNAESHRDVAVAEMGKFKADLARLTKPGPASDEELRSVWCKAHREAMSAAGQHYRALTAAERALYTYGLAHARAEQAVLPTCRLTIEDDDDGYKAICEDGVGIAKSRSTTACKRIVAALSAAEHRRESERDAVADFIYGHAKRLGEQSGADGDELMVEIHDVLNHLRADENGEVFDGRAERATPTPASGPTDEEIARAIHVAIFGVPVPSKTEHDRLTAAITTVVRPMLTAAADERAQREEIRFEANITAVAKQRDEAIARVQQAEQERDAYKRDLDAELRGSLTLRATLGYRDDETMHDGAERIAAELSRLRTPAKVAAVVEAAPPEAICAVVDTAPATQPPPVPPPCTGLTATWCPRCGRCRCEKREEGGEMNESRCPLHAPESDHAEDEADLIVTSGLVDALLEADVPEEAPVPPPVPEASAFPSMCPCGHHSGAHSCMPPGKCLAAGCECKRDDAPPVPERGEVPHAPVGSPDLARVYAEAAAKWPYDSTRHDAGLVAVADEGVRKYVDLARLTAPAVDAARCAVCGEAPPFGAAVTKGHAEIPWCHGAECRAKIDRAIDVLRGKEPAPAMDAGRLVEAYRAALGRPRHTPYPDEIEAMRFALATVGAGGGILRHLSPVAPPVAPEAEPPAVPREAVTVEAACFCASADRRRWRCEACGASVLDSGAQHVGSVIAGGG